MPNEDGGFAPDNVDQISRLLDVVRGVPLVGASKKANLILCSDYDDTQATASEPDDWHCRPLPLDTRAILRKIDSRAHFCFITGRGGEQFYKLINYGARGDKWFPTALCEHGAVEHSAESPEGRLTFELNGAGKQLRFIRDTVVAQVSRKYGLPVEGGKRTCITFHPDPTLPGVDFGERDPKQVAQEIVKMVKDEIKSGGMDLQVYVHPYTIEVSPSAVDKGCAVTDIIDNLVAQGDFIPSSGFPIVAGDSTNDWPMFEAVLRRTDIPDCNKFLIRVGDRPIPGENIVLSDDPGLSGIDKLKGILGRVADVLPTHSRGLELPTAVAAQAAVQAR